MVSQSDQATYTYVKTEPGSSFTYTLSPDLSAGGMWGSCQEMIMVNPVPVIMGFQGVSGDVATGFRQIVGQKLVATVTAGTYTFSGMNWSVQGPDFFNPISLLFGISATTYSTFAASMSSGQAYQYLLVPTGASYGTAYFADPAQYTFFASGQATLNGQEYQVLARRSINVVEPTTIDNETRAASGGIWQSNAQQEIVGCWPVPDGEIDRTPQIKWTISVSTPPGFDHLGQGRWQLLQLVTPSRTVVRGDGSSWISQYQGLQGLDSTLPYLPESLAGRDAGFPDDGALRNAATDALYDAPDQLFPLDTTSVTIGDAFQMYLMYRPFDAGLGSEWVPLRYTPWSWNVQVVPPGGVWPANPAAAGSVSGSPTEVWRVYPSWGRVIMTSLLMRAPQ